MIGEWSQTWTFFDGEWREGNVPLWGARTHAIWLGSSVWDGARVFDDLRAAHPGGDPVGPDAGQPSHVGREAQGSTVEDHQGADSFLFDDEREPEDGLEGPPRVVWPEVLVSEIEPLVRQDGPCDLGIVARDR